MIALPILTAIILAAMHDGSVELGSKPLLLHERTFSPDSDKSRIERQLQAPATIVGVQICGRCHREQADSLAMSSHSRTFAHTSQSVVARFLHGKEFVDPERGHTYRYHFDPRDGLSVTIPGKFEKSFPLEYALGSGTNAVTFLSLVPSRDPDGTPSTIGLEHRVSVFPKAKLRKLDLTPGQAGRKAEQAVSEFGVALTPKVLGRCIGCHTTESQISGQSLIDVRANVSCENCHGPGSRHVAAAELHVEPLEYPRLHSGNNTTGRELAMCGECHRRPEMIDGEVRRDDPQVTRFQIVGLMQSRCYLESGKELRCTACHDPHAGISHDVGRYVAECLKCHQPETGKAHPCPVSSMTDCIRCHMPRVRAVHEVSFTDHWIRVRDKRDAPAEWPIPLGRPK